MKHFIVGLFLCFTIGKALNAQRFVPRAEATTIINNLKKQGYIKSNERKIEFLAGFERRVPCKQPISAFEHYGKQRNSVFEPDQFHYWISLKERQEILMVKIESDVTVVYFKMRIVEQVDPFTYKIEETYCFCPSCDGYDPVTETIDPGEICLYDEALGKCRTGSGNPKCKTVKKTRYFCGRLIYK